MGKEIATRTGLQPIILAEGQYTDADLAELRKNQNIWREVNVYHDQLGELFEIQNPDKRLGPDFAQLQKDYVDERRDGGSWVYFPWSGYLSHIVNEADYFSLRTNRNQNLITHDEQERLAEFTVGVTGLSVGAGIALGVAQSGISNTIKLAEMDTLETANLNRLRGGIHQIGEAKIDLAARAIYELNPYATVGVLADGLNDANLNVYFGSDPVNVAFDEIDDFPMKIKLRMAARDAGVPVIMLTSLGDNILIDVERYDLDPKTELFNGLLGSLPEEILRHPVGEREKVKYAMQIVGVEHIPTRALESLFEINRTLVGRPQIASTIIMDGGLGAYLVRRLALGEELPSGRSYLSLDSVMDLADGADGSRREAVLAKLNMMLGSK